MVQTRHSSKDVLPKQDLKDGSSKEGIRRSKEPRDPWDANKNRKGNIVKEASYHLYNGQMEEERKLERSGGPETSGHNLRYGRAEKSFNKDSTPYAVKKKKITYEKGEKFSPQSDPAEADSHERRRSGRLRREVYGSLNERMICYEPHYKKNKVKTGEEDSDSDQEQDKSMYDYVKKHRRQENVTPEKHGKSSICRPKCDLGSDENDEDEDDDEEGEDEELEEQEEEQEEQEDESLNAASYSLRKTKPITKRYTAPPISGTRKRRISALYAIPHSPMHKANHRRIPQHSSPHHRSRKRVFGERRKHYGSSTSSSSGDSDDEVRFEKRKRKSMALARSRCLPMNFASNDVIGLIKDRERARGRGNVGSSLADIEPMSIDNKVTFESIGGLDRHIRALKEMVVFPLMYPEVFEKFKITPPRGVLFHGPPGTGKTLVARALANECGLGGHKVAFFMRKGADCLSKWVGESERQLRLLFDQAYAMRPSIIFFDEIDGLAPVRSTRQDQIHSSIVSTLLALMDGLDSRGEIVVIGATNRIDSIDPALRRPGRFDREFLFTLPNSKARKEIFEIHTKDWQPRLSKAFQKELADYTVGYCGADIKALCTEAALFALRRRYPQIYGTNMKLVIDVENVKVSAKDFRNAMTTITPASQRAVVSPGRALEINIKPLLLATLEEVLNMVRNLFPAAKLKEARKEVDNISGTRNTSTVLEDEECSSDDDETQFNIYEPVGIGRSTRRIQRLSSPPPAPPEHGFLSVLNRPHAQALPHRPRFIMSGKEGMGQSSHLGPAILHSMEHLTVHVLDLPALFGVSTRVPEEACAQIFREARRTSPCVIYLPHIGTWWNSISETTRATFVTLLDDLPPSSAILLMSTSNTPFEELPDRVRGLFSKSASEVFDVHPPTKLEREEYFRTLLLIHALQKRQPTSKKKNERLLETLPVAPTPQARQLNDAEVAELRKQEENTLRELRLFLRQISWKLMADRKFKEFSKPVDLEEVPDYLDVIKNPMDLSTIMTRINSHYYQNCSQYLTDIDLITNNCLEYNPDKDQFDRLLRNRACELRDTAYAMVEADLDPEFEKMCVEIVKSREERGETRGFNAPSYVRCLQKNMNSLRTSLTANSANRENNLDGKTELDRGQNEAFLTSATGMRSSKRLKGIHAPEIVSTDVPIEHNMKEKCTRVNVSDPQSVLTTETDETEQKTTLVDEADETSANEALQDTSSQNEKSELLEVPSEVEETALNAANYKSDETPDESEDKVVNTQENLEDMEEKETCQFTPSRNLFLALEESGFTENDDVEPEKDEEKFPVVEDEKITVDFPPVEVPQECREDKESTAVNPPEEITDPQCLLAPQEHVSLDDWKICDTTDDSKDKLEKALKYLVEKTDGFSVTAVEKIYSSISKLIYRHQRQENRYSLISEIVNLIDRL